MVCTLSDDRPVPCPARGHLQRDRIMRRQFLSEIHLQRHGGNGALSCDNSRRRRARFLADLGGAFGFFMLVPGCPFLAHPVFACVASQKRAIKYRQSAMGPVGILPLAISSFTRRRSDSEADALG